MCLVTVWYLLREVVLIFGYQADGSTGLLAGRPAAVAQPRPELASVGGGWTK